MTSFLGRVARRVKSSVEEFGYNARYVVDAPPQRVLHRFRHADDIAQWTTTSDKIVGGFSECSFEQHGKVGLFTGNLSLKTSGDMLRSGFATVRTLPYDKVPNLEPFSALELRLRTDGRPYLLNVKCEDMSEAIFQGKMVLPPHKWFTVALPFSSFLLTHRGRIVDVQQELDPSAICGFGVLIADGVAGPFRLEIDYIKAIRDFDPDEYARVPEGRPAKEVRGAGGVREVEAGAASAVIEADEEAATERDAEAAVEDLEERKRAAMVK